MSKPLIAVSLLRFRHQVAPAFSAVRTTHACGAGWQRTFFQEAHARAKASAV
jgi:hypothetical protein